MHVDGIYIIFILSITLIVYNIYEKRRLDINDKQFNKKLNGYNFFINTSINFLLIGISILIRSLILLYMAILIFLVIVLYHMYNGKKYKWLVI
jgi:hypothetical protein